MRPEERLWTGLGLLTCWLLLGALARWRAITPAPQPSYAIGVDFVGYVRYEVTEQEQSCNGTGKIVTLSAWQRTPLQFDWATKTFDTHNLNNVILNYGILQLLYLYDYTRYLPPKLTVQYDFYSVLRASNNESMCIMTEPSAYWSSTYSFLMSVSTWQFDANVRAAVSTRLNKRVPVIYYEAQYALYDDDVTNSIAVNPGRYGIRADYVNVGTCYTPTSDAVNRFLFWVFIVVCVIGLMGLTGAWFDKF